MGAGSGAFAFHFIQRLLQLCGRIDLPTDSFVYVMSDVAESNVAAWRAHPQLRPYIDREILVCTTYDASASRRPPLQSSKRQPPLIAIANYLFDTMEQELFFIRDQRVYECRIQLESDADPATLDIAGLMQSIHYNVEIGAQVRPEIWETRFPGMLDRYKAATHEGYVAFPIGALACVEELRKSSESGAIIFVADKAHHDLRLYKSVPVICHGSATFNVDFGALAQFCEHRGGSAYFGKPPASIGVGALLFTDGLEHRWLLDAFQEHIVDFGPDDVYSLYESLGERIDDLNVQQIASLVRLGRYDGSLLARCLPSLWNRASALSDDDIEIIAHLAEHCIEHCYEIGDNDLAFDLGCLFFCCRDYARALTYFMQSAERKGIHAGAMFNAALCCGLLGHAEEELRLLEELVHRDPAYAPASERLACL